MPLAVCFGIVADRLGESKWFREARLKKIPFLLLMVGIYALMSINMIQGYRLFDRFRNPSMQVEEIKAAYWFRGHSQMADRILTEYFTAQMFSGICAGRTLLGSMFPLKNVSIPYINNGWEVQRDIYSVYLTDDPQVIRGVLRKYGCTHVFLSRKVLRHIEYFTQGDQCLEDR